MKERIAGAAAVLVSAIGLAVVLAGCGGLPLALVTPSPSSPAQAAPTDQTPVPASTPNLAAIAPESAVDCTVSIVGSDALVNYKGPSADSLCSDAQATGIPLPGDPNNYSYVLLPDNPIEATVCQLRAADDGTTANVMDTGSQLIGENLCEYMLQVG